MPSSDTFFSDMVGDEEADENAVLDFSAKLEN